MNIKITTHICVFRLSPTLPLLSFKHRKPLANYRKLLLYSSFQRHHQVSYPSLDAPPLLLRARFLPPTPPAPPLFPLMVLDALLMCPLCFRELLRIER